MIVLTFLKKKGKINKEEILKNFKNTWRQHLEEIIDFTNEKNFIVKKTENDKKIIDYLIIPRGCLAGGSSLSFTISLQTLNQLNTLVKEYYFYFTGEEYKNEYAWIDDLSIVRDKGRLDDKLIEKLRDKKLMSLALQPRIL